jgi:hypothetical protein
MRHSPYEVPTLLFIFDHPLLLGLLLGIALGLALDVGRQVAVRYRIDQTPERKEQMGTIRDGFFILLSLLLGFTLTFAATRFAERRSLAVEEAVSIGTTYLRASTLPQPYRDRSKQLLREYLDARLAMDDQDSSQFNEAMSRFKVIQGELWLDAASVAQNDRSAITAVYINSLNETIDLDAKRIAAFEYHVAPPLWILIIFVALIAGFTRGATMTSRFWLSLILIPITIAIVVALIADLDTPTHGLIRLDQRTLQRIKTEIGGEVAH